MTYEIIQNSIMVYLCVINQFPKEKETHGITIFRKGKIMCNLKKLLLSTRGDTVVQEDIFQKLNAIMTNFPNNTIYI